jgi:hypothetical protein
MSLPIEPLDDDDRGRRRLLVAVSAVLLLAYGAYAAQEALHGKWSHLVAIVLAALTYVVFPRLEGRLAERSPGSPAKRPRVPPKPVRDALWSLGVFFLIMAVFTLVNG